MPPQDVGLSRRPPRPANRTQDCSAERVFPGLRCSLCLEGQIIAVIPRQRVHVDAAAGCRQVAPPRPANRTRQANPSPAESLPPPPSPSLSLAVVACLTRFGASMHGRGSEISASGICRLGTRRLRPLLEAELGAHSSTYANGCIMVKWSDPYSCLSQSSGEPRIAQTDGPACVPLPATDWLTTTRLK